MLQKEIRRIFREVVSCYRGNSPQLLFGKSLLGHTPKEGMAMNWGLNVILVNPQMNWNKLELQKAFSHELGHFIHCQWIMKHPTIENVNEFLNVKSCEEIGTYLGNKLYLEKVLPTASISKDN